MLSIIDKNIEELEKEIEKQTKVIKNYNELYTQETLKESSIFKGLKEKLRDLATQLHKWQELKQELDKIIDKYEEKVKYNNRLNQKLVDECQVYAIDLTNDNEVLEDILKDLRS
jgi:DNA repair exonuclease SbcCD ATPase subunit